MCIKHRSTNFYKKNTIRLKTTLNLTNRQVGQAGKAKLRNSRIKWLCGGPTESGLQRLIYLNGWSLVGRAISGGLGGVLLLLEEVSLGLGLEVSKVHTMPSISLPPVCG